jgi:hypothetical protein
MFSRASVQSAATRVAAVARGTRLVASRAATPLKSPGAPESAGSGRRIPRAGARAKAPSGVQLLECAVRRPPPRHTEVAVFPREWYMGVG